MWILILSLSDLGRDPRVYRQMLYLRERRAATVMGLAAPDFDVSADGLDYIPIRGVRLVLDRRACADGLGRAQAVDLALGGP